MSGISFRYRKTHEHVDSSYSLWDQEQLGDVSTWLVGDIVSVCFPDQSDTIKAIADDCPGRFEFYQSGDLLCVECEVVKRHRSIIWRDVGKFERLSASSVVLEATNGYWEDILLWVAIGKVPEWLELE